MKRHDRSHREWTQHREEEPVDLKESSSSQVIMSMKYRLRKIAPGKLISPVYFIDDYFKNKLVVFQCFDQSS